MNLPSNTCRGKLDLCPWVWQKKEWNFSSDFEKKMVSTYSFSLQSTLSYHGPRSGKARPRRRSSCTQSVRSRIGNGSILALATTLTKYSTKCALLCVNNVMILGSGKRFMFRSILDQKNETHHGKREKENKDSISWIYLKQFVVVNRIANFRILTENVWSRWKTPISTSYKRFQIISRHNW